MIWCTFQDAFLRKNNETSRILQISWIIPGFSSGHKMLNLINLTSIRTHVLLVAGSHLLVTLHTYIHTYLAITTLQSGLGASFSHHSCCVR